ncbi:MAG: hypothetical protein ISR54_10010 [Chlorobium phaeobacteroides]|uniref:Uncharacterized protein n=1 Tax=Chlorobium phaeobacteroides (strain BS1) TaxID=331678 RepID=B3EKK9_CHLPB|nr:hypothetical protein [Chlorobium phaeobacteroides]
MGEKMRLTESVRMVWRDAALFIAQAMREEVAETGSKRVEERADEVEAFAEGLIPPFDGKVIREGTGWTDERILSVLRDSGRVQTSLLQGLMARADSEKWDKWEKSESLEAEEQRRMSKGRIKPPDQQFIMYKATNLLRDLLDNEAAPKQYIIWRDTTEHLEELAEKLRTEGFIDDANIFTGQFQCAGIRAAKKLCQWLDDSALLVYLFDRLKQENLINKKNYRDKLLTNRFQDEKGKPVENIRQMRNSYRNNSKTLNGEPNIKNNGVPFDAEKIERIFEFILAK